MNARRLAAWTAAGFTIFYVLSNPTGAAGAIRSATGLLVGAAESLSRFVSALS